MTATFAFLLSILITDPAGHSTSTALVLDEGLSLRDCLGLFAAAESHAQILPNGVQIFQAPECRAEPAA